LRKFITTRPEEYLVFGWFSVASAGKRWRFLLDYFALKASTATTGVPNAKVIISLYLLIGSCIRKVGVNGLRASPFLWFVFKYLLSSSFSYSRRSADS
jgi:hypothetical protein